MCLLPKHPDIKKNANIYLILLKVEEILKTISFPNHNLTTFYSVLRAILQYHNQKATFFVPDNTQHEIKAIFESK